MGYPKVGCLLAGSTSAINDELYALVKRLKRSSSRRFTVLDDVKRLIAAGADVNQTGRPKGPLLAVVLSSKFVRDETEEVAQMLLQHRADPNAPVRGLYTAIGQKRLPCSHVAQLAVSEHILPNVCIRLILLLAEHGADLNRRARNGCTALDIAILRLSEWEHWFDFQRLRGTNGPYSRELELGFSLLTCAVPFSTLVEVILGLGGQPALFRKDQAEKCLERMERIREGCADARNEALAKAAASGLELEEYFMSARVCDAGLKMGFAQMDVGDPTFPVTLR